MAIFNSLTWIIKNAFIRTVLSQQFTVDVDNKVFEFADNIENCLWSTSTIRSAVYSRPQPQSLQLTDGRPQLQSLQFTVDLDRMICCIKSTSTRTSMLFTVDLDRMICCIKSTSTLTSMLFTVDLDRLVCFIKSISTLRSMMFTVDLDRLVC